MQTQNLKSRSYKDLVVWQKSVNLSILIYKLTSDFPKEEVYGITSQMRRSAVSIPSNLAEGSMRGTEKDFKNFIKIALGSTAELQTQLFISKQLTFGEESDYNGIEGLINEIMKMLHSLHFSLKT